MKTGYAIYLDEDQQNFFKAWLKCKSDPELRNTLQNLLDDAIKYQRDIRVQLDDLVSMRQDSKIKD